MKHLVGMVCLGLLLGQLTTVYTRSTWVQPNSQVGLKHCAEDHCVFSGTLSRQPWTGDYELEMQDGKTLVFGEDQISWASWPIDGAPT